MSDTPGHSVLVVVLDTVRKDHLVPYGYDRPTTPGLAEFAEEARVYEQAVTPAPWTLPVHASMFTGLYPSGHEATQEDPYLADDITTLAESLSAAGYATACFSSNAWITPYTRLTAGFTHQDNFFEVMPGELLAGPLADLWQRLNDSDRLRRVADGLVELGNTLHERLADSSGADSKTPEVIDRLIEFVDACDDGDEYFAFVNLMDAHLPYYPPEEYRAEFAPDVDPATVCQNSKEYNAGARDIDDDEWDAIRGLYDAEIRHIDAQLVRLFDWLRENDEWEDTVVVVCADHGELHGEHDLYGHEFCLYEPVINVPLLVKHPDLDPGRDEETTVELLDLYHTVLDAAGVDGEESAVEVDPARSLVREEYREFGSKGPGRDGSNADADHGSNADADHGSNADADHGSNARPGSHPGSNPTDGRYAFVEYHRPVVELKQLESKAEAAGVELDENSRFYSRMRAARRPEAKYIRNERIADEAYRLDGDPGETTPVDPAEDEVVSATESALVAFETVYGGEWREDGDGDGGREDVLEDMSEDARQRLRDLGYVE